MEALVAILAGGRGERAGGAKPSLELAGHALVHYPVSAAVAAGAEAAVFAKPDTELPALEIPIVREPQEPHHPLCGIVAALRQARGPVIAVACDLPFVTSGLLAWLDAFAELAVPALAGRLHPLLARYDPSHLDTLERALAEGEPLQETVRALGPRLIGEPELRAFGDPERLLFNVNTRDDLVEAERLLAP